MMKDCAERAFHTLRAAAAAQFTIADTASGTKRMGNICMRSTFYRLAEDYDAALRVIQRDAGILLASLGAQQVLRLHGPLPGRNAQGAPACRFSF